MSNNNLKQLNDEMLSMMEANFQAFAELTGFDVQRAYICMLKAKGKSYGQIAILLNKTRDEVRGIHRRNCGCIQPSQNSNQ